MEPLSQHPLNQAIQAEHIPEPISQVSASIRYDFRFTGTGSEYFRIWIVNLLLILVTLFLYYPWAKVRKLKYLHSNFLLDGTAFDYQANPVGILKGTLLAAALYMAYHFVSDGASLLGLGIFSVCMAMLLPWLLWKSFRFKLANTSYRALPFRFMGTLKQAYVTFVPPILFYTFISALLTVYLPELADKAKSKPENTDGFASFALFMGLYFLGIVLLSPVFYTWLKRFQHNNYQWTSLKTSIELPMSKVFWQWMLAVMSFAAFYVLVGILVALGIGAVFISRWLLVLIPFLFVITLLIPSFFRAVFTSRFQNLIWNNTRAQGIRFVSELKVKSLTWLYTKNLFFLIITFGFYWPFAMMAVIRMRAASVHLVTAAPIMHLAAQHAPSDAERNAIGDAAGDMFDFDISI